MSLESVRSWLAEHAPDLMLIEVDYFSSHRAMTRPLAGFG